VDIKVSVFCLTFNHEKYIRQALDGFVMQKTNFPFEILVHDDASTDNTPKIIREYAEKYPHIIKPVFQTENQYSKKIGIIKNFLLPLAQGEYFAWCEGDDYWTDPYKLQKQIDFLNENKEYSICVHKAVVRGCSFNTEQQFPSIESDKDFSVEEIIRHGGGIFATNSLMMKKEIYVEKPDCFYAPSFGDFQLFIYGAIRGKCMCLADVMSVYNRGVPGSWTNLHEAAVEKKISHYRDMIDMLNRVNVYYKYEYNDAISYRIHASEAEILILQKNFKALRQDPYATYWKKRRKSICFLKIKKKFPFLVKIKRKIFK